MATHSFGEAAAHEQAVVEHNTRVLVNHPVANDNTIHHQIRMSQVPSNKLEMHSNASLRIMNSSAFALAS